MRSPWLQASPAIGDEHVSVHARTPASAVGVLPPLALALRHRSRPRAPRPRSCCRPGAATPAVEPARLLCKSLGARSVSVSALPRWTRNSVPGRGRASGCKSLTNRSLRHRRRFSSLPASPAATRCLETSDPASARWARRSMRGSVRPSSRHPPGAAPRSGARGRACPPSRNTHGQPPSRHSPHGTP
jgi:hypothetical protein